MGVSEEPDQQAYDPQQAYAPFIPQNAASQPAQPVQSPFYGGPSRFDNVDISGNNHPKDETPFGRVQEFVSVSNRVRRGFFRFDLLF